MRHPREWGEAGYHEIQRPREKYRIIDRAALSNLLGVPEYRLAEVCEQWIEAALARGDRSREPQWSEALAVGRQSFVERVQRDLGTRGQYRRIEQGEGMLLLREAAATYRHHFDGEMGCLSVEIGPDWR